MPDLGSEGTPFTRRQWEKAFSFSNLFPVDYKGLDLEVQIAQDQPKTYMELLAERPEFEPHTCDETCACQNCGGTKDLIYNMDGDFHICGYFDTCNIPDSRRLHPHGAEPVKRTPEEIDHLLRLRCPNCDGLHIEECLDGPYDKLSRSLKKLSSSIRKLPDLVRDDIKAIQVFIDGKEVELKSVGDLKIGEMTIEFTPAEQQEMTTQIGGWYVQEEE